MSECERGLLAAFPDLAYRYDEASADFTVFREDILRGYVLFSPIPFKGGNLMQPYVADASLAFYRGGYRYSTVTLFLLKRTPEFAADTLDRHKIDDGIAAKNGFLGGVALEESLFIIDGLDGGVNPQADRSVRAPEQPGLRSHPS